MPELLCVDRLSFSYPQDGRGLTPVSFTLDRGEGLLISSPSGSGKSTLARCLAGLIPHLYHGRFTGDVWLDGYRTDQTPLWQLTEIAGLVFQNPATQMLSASVEDEILFGLENLGLPATEVQHRTGEILAQFGLSDFRKRSPQTLSGGEQQKLALAAIFARRPQLLLLDEPLSMLDSTASAVFIDSLNQCTAGGQAVVICEHRSESLQPLKELRLFALVDPHRSSENLPPPSSPEAEIERLWPSPGDDLRVDIHRLQIQRSGRTIIDGLDLELRGGQVTAIVGRNGVGKTTLLRAMAGLQAFDGKITVRTGSNAGAPELGLTFQNPNLQLFNASVGQEILYRAPNPDPDLYRRLLGILDLERYENTPPLLLSEGEKRRLALAIVLMHRPAHGILLDEPALGQDPSHKAYLMKILRRVAAEGRLVVFATHDIHLAAQADRLLLLGSKGLLADGAPEQVYADATAWERAGLAPPK